MHGDESQVLQVNKNQVGHFSCLNSPGIDSSNLEAVLRDHLHQLGGGQHGGNRGVPGILGDLKQRMLDGAQADGHGNPTRAFLADLVGSE